MVVAHSPLHAIGTMRRYTGMEHRTNLAEGQESLGLGFSEPVTGPHAASNAPLAAEHPIHAGWVTMKDKTGNLLPRSRTNQ